MANEQRNPEEPPAIPENWYGDKELGAYNMTDDSRPKPRRRDPHRRDRIIDAALEVISRDGVTGVSHRRVAHEAGVPLGSMTYYFSGIHDLLMEAFTRFTDQAVADYREQFIDCTTLEQARSAIVRILTDSSYMDPRNIIIGSELYSQSTHDPRFRPILLAWIHRCRDAFRIYFDEPTTFILDAMVEGVSMHRSLEQDIHSAELIASAVELLTPESSFIYDPAKEPAPTKVEKTEE